MKNVKIDENKIQGSSKQIRKVYNKPSLLYYGSIKDVTQKSGASVDSSMTNPTRT